MMAFAVLIAVIAAFVASVLIATHLCETRIDHGAK